MADTTLVICLLAVTVTTLFTWQAISVVRQDADEPSRLVSELRLSQVGASLLILVAGAYLGSAASLASHHGAGLDATLALGFLAAGVASLTREPREALTIVALAFVAHAVVDILHRPGGLTDGGMPRWYVIGCAVQNVWMAALTFLPVFGRRL